MALQFSLASVNPAGLTKPIDFPGIEQKQLDVQQSRMNVAEQQRQTTEAAQTRGAFDEYLKQGGDLFTPAGLQKAATDLRGKIPASEYMKLGPALQKAQEADLKYRASLQKLNDDELAGQLNIFSTAGPAVTAAYDVFEKTKKDKGDVTALAEFENTRNNLVAQYGPIWSKSPYGQQALKTLSGITPDQVPMLNRMSGYSAAALKEEAERRQAEYRGAQTRRAEAETKALESGVIKGAENLQAPDGRTVTNVPGQPLRYTDTKEPYLGSPTELKPIVTAKGRAATVPVAQQIEEATDLTKAPATDAELKQAEQYILTGKMPQVGTGTAASIKRQRILAIATERAGELGMSPAEVEQTRNKLNASKEAAKRLTTQKAIIQAGEKNVQNVLDILQAEVQKLGGVQSPKVQAVLNRARTQWMGDPDYIGINQAYMDLIENMARVYSGQTGAGGTPVSFLKLAEKSLPENPTLAQVLKLRETVPALFEARKKATEEELDAVFKMASLPKAPAKPFGYKPGDEKSETPDYIRSRYDEFIAKMKDPKLTPTERDRYRRDAKEARDQLEAMKAPLPPLSDLGESGAPAAKAMPSAADLKAYATKYFKGDEAKARAFLEKQGYK